MKKFIKALMSVVIIGGVVGCSASNESDGLTGTYSIHVEGYDWGCGVDKAIIKFSDKVSDIDKDDFKVTEHKQVTDWSAKDKPVIEDDFTREVTNAYNCNKNGEKVDSESEYVALELYCSPNDGSPLLYSMSTMFNTWSDPYYLDINLTKNASVTSNGEKVEKISVDKDFTERTTEADPLKVSSFKSSDKIAINYGLYESKNNSDTLFVWLHGSGEGGTENTSPTVTALANEVTAFISDDFQNTLGGANVLVPQCPTNWIDTDGKGKIMNDDGTFNFQKNSYYTKTLKELIDSVKKSTNSKKVVIAGCSAGGYMTMKLVLENPDYFTAVVPVCEAYPDEFITDENINSIKDLPMYFIYSKDDESAVPSEFSVPTIERLKNAGASNLHVSTTDHVIDLSGTLNDLNEGKSYQYNGHWSWIYFDNNESKCDYHSENVWNWIANQLK